MRLGERDRCAGLEGDDGDVHVVAEIGGIDEPRRRPSSVGARHWRRRDVSFIGHDRIGQREIRHTLIEFSDPVEMRRARAAVAHGP
jgi:hypothetical protein